MGCIVVGVDGGGQIADVAAVFVLKLPIGDHGGRDLEGELEGVGEGGGAKGLVGTSVGGGEKGGTGWEVPGVGVPMEDGFGRGERGEKRVGGGGGSEADVKPSNFLDGVAVDLGAESAGDERSEEHTSEL